MCEAGTCQLSPGLSITPLFTVCDGNAGRTPIFHCFCEGAKVSPGTLRPLICAWISPSPKPSCARTGINSVLRAPGLRLTFSSGLSSSETSPLAVRETVRFCALSVRLLTSSARRDSSPPARKRGILISAISGAATITFASLLPKLSAVQACAMTRSSPLKSPIGSCTVPSPFSFSTTGSACCATIVT